MIAYPELERALRRWKARQAGGAAEAALEDEPVAEASITEASFDDESAHEVTAEAVVSEAFTETTVAVVEPEDATSLIPVVEFETGQK